MGRTDIPGPMGDSWYWKRGFSPSILRSIGEGNHSWAPPTLCRDRSLLIQTSGRSHWKGKRNILVQCWQLQESNWQLQECNFLSMLRSVHYCRVTWHRMQQKRALLQAKAMCTIASTLVCSMSQVLVMPKFSSIDKAYDDRWWRRHSLSLVLFLWKWPEQ